MTFLAPERLALLVLPVLLIAAYLLVQRRRQAFVVRFTDPALLDAVAPRHPGWRRHVVAAGYLAAIAVIVVAAARPAAAMPVVVEPTVVLAFDTSLSMSARDVAPTRLVAAREAAKRFLEVVPDGALVGLVAFDGSARPVVAPTVDRAAVARALDRLELGEGTAIGEAISNSLGVLEAAGVDLDGPAAGDREAAANGAIDGGDGEAVPGAIVLLSDGESTVGRAVGPEVARAAAAGIGISTIAFGTDHGSITLGGLPIPVGVDRAGLGRIADATGGRALNAESAAEIAAVYEDLGRSLSTRVEPREVTDAVVLAGLVLAVVAAAGSLAWFSRLP